MTNPNSNCLRLPSGDLKPLTEYRLAESHWRKPRPKTAAQFAANGRLRFRLSEAMEQTGKVFDRTRRPLMKQGSTPRQARAQAWQTVGRKFIFLTPEN